MVRLVAAVIIGAIGVGAVVPVASWTRARPRLVVILSIDQFRGDYVQQYGHQWTRGLRRLLQEGAYYSRAAYPYMNTVTCPGHATIATGTFPATHGLPLNAWWDRATNQQVLCTADPAARNIAFGAVGATGGDSPWRLRVPTFSDELRLQSPIAPRVVTMSLKARSAIALAGQRADLAVWYDRERGFVTSSVFGSDPTPFMDGFLAAHPIEADAGRIWERSLPAGAYLFTDDAAGEQPEAPWTSTFPHVLVSTPGEPAGRFGALWEDSPFADAYLGRLAAAAVDHWRMGRGPATDYLAVSFSVLDNVGHGFGPHSHEVQDVLVRLDATIGTLLEDLDRQIGRDHYVVAATSDHGISPIPEQVAEKGVAAGRIDGRALVSRVNDALVPWLGAGPHVATVIYTDLYFHAGVYAKLLEQPAAMQAVVDLIEATPGVLRVLRSDEIATLRLGVDQVSQRAFYSFAPGRSGDLLIVPRPYYLNSTAPSTHGTGYDYDARVPIILMGPGVTAGEYVAPASPADIVPTLAYLVGVTMPYLDGRILHEALAPRAADVTGRTAAGTGGTQDPADR
jgi:predicted AlkP superfamily pyrophosphatase or phosphodiesterase